jgi:hypothetical protein
MRPLVADYAVEVGQPADTVGADRPGFRGLNSQ